MVTIEYDGVSDVECDYEGPEPIRVLIVEPKGRPAQDVAGLYAKHRAGGEDALGYWLDKVEIHE